MAKVALLALILAAPALAGELRVDLRGGQAGTVRLETAVDDSHLENPPGYARAEPATARVVEGIVIENVGRDPIRDPDVRLNGAPLLPVNDPLAILGLRDATDLLAVFAAWRDRRIHGTTDLDANRHPLEVLRAFGVTFCGDDSRALGAITIPHGAEVRFPRLNGHSAAEHRLGGDWMLLDGDQNAFYLRWDNRTLASAADLLADPLLALRTKIYGRHSRWAAAIAWQNAARFEFVEVDAPPKILRLKRPPPVRSWELLPGESVTIQLARTPETAHGASEELRRNANLRGATCVVELGIDFAARRARGGAVSLPFPAVSRVTGEPVYEAPASAEAILCQAARIQFPQLRVGGNQLVLAGAGSVRVTFLTRESSLQAVPPPEVAAPRTFREAPRFALTAKDADKRWWQISDSRNFRVVAPNLDVVEPFTGEVTLGGALDETFLSPDREWFFRAKVRRAGVWSDWSEPVAFTVTKPAQPRIRAVEPADGNRMLIRWTPAEGEMLVFGSNRLDFLPEVYGDTEIVHLDGGAVRESRPNHNLLATVAGRDGEAWVPLRAAYRLIVRQEGALSVPSALARTRGPAQVLQNRHEKAEGALTGRDVAREMPVPVAAEGGR